MTIALLTHYLPTPQEDYQQLADLAVPQRDAYCARHGYRHIVQRGSFRSDAYYAYDRLVLLRDLMDRPDAASVYWLLNLSSIITTPAVAVEQYLSPEYDFFLTKDVHGIQGGSMLFRNTPWTRDWLDFLISLEPQYRSGWHEQQCIADHWLHERWAYKIDLLPQHTINAFRYILYPPWDESTSGNWRPGDLVLSLPGTTLAQRLKIWREWPVLPTSLS